MNRDIERAIDRHAQVVMIYARILQTCDSGHIGQQQVMHASDDAKMARDSLVAAICNAVRAADERTAATE